MNVGMCWYVFDPKEKKEKKKEKKGGRCNVKPQVNLVLDRRYFVFCSQSSQYGRKLDKQDAASQPAFDGGLGKG